VLTPKDYDSGDPEARLRDQEALEGERRAQAQWQQAQQQAAAAKAQTRKLLQKNGVVDGNGAPIDLDKIDPRNPADLNALRQAVDDAFNRRYAAPDANEKVGWGHSAYTPAAQEIRNSLDAQKAAVMQAIGAQMQASNQSDAASDALLQAGRAAADAEGRRQDELNGIRLLQGLPPLPGRPAENTPHWLPLGPGSGPDRAPAGPEQPPAGTEEHPTPNLPQPTPKGGPADTPPPAPPPAPPSPPAPQPPPPPPPQQPQQPQQTQQTQQTQEPQQSAPPSSPSSPATLSPQAQWTQQSIADARAGRKLYSITPDGQFQLSPTRPLDSLTAAVTDGVIPNPSADVWQALGGEQQRVEADIPHVSPGPDTAWQALQAGRVGEAAGKAWEGFRQNLSPLFGATEAQKIAEAVPVHDAAGHVHYEYKPWGDETAKRGLFPAISDAGSAMLDPVTAYQLAKAGKAGLLSNFDEQRQKQLLPPDPQDSRATAIWKAVHNTVLNTQHAVVNPATLLLPGSRLLSGAFAAQSAYSAAQQAGQAQQAPTLQEKIERWLSAILSAGMAGAAGTHAVRGGGPGRLGHGDGSIILGEGGAGLDLTPAPTEALQAALHDPKIAARLDPDMRAQIAAELARRQVSASSGGDGLSNYKFDEGSAPGKGEGGAPGAASSGAGRAPTEPFASDLLGALYRDYWAHTSRGLSQADAEAIARAHGFSFETGRRSRFENKRGVVIAKSSLRDGLVNSLELAEEIQHGLDRKTHEAARFGRLHERSGLSEERFNDMFHAEHFQRIVDNYRKGQFTFLHPEEIETLKGIIQKLR
jgi:hypothetical protein